MTELEFRAPRREDADLLAAMVDKLNLHEGDPTGHFTAERALADVIAPEARVSCLLAERAGAPLGYALWHYSYETAWAEHGVYLADLYVREAARGQGVGDGLLRAVARAAAADGATFVWWTAYRTNDNARAFYRARAAEEDRIVAYALVHERFAALAAP